MRKEKIVLYFLSFLLCRGYSIRMIDRKDAIPFLPSDAKVPEFNLQPFHSRSGTLEKIEPNTAIVEDFKSHPFSVMVVPKVEQRPSASSMKISIVSLRDLMRSAQSSSIQPLLRSRAVDNPNRRHFKASDSPNDSQEDTFLDMLVNIFSTGAQSSKANSFLVTLNSDEDRAESNDSDEDSFLVTVSDEDSPTAVNVNVDDVDTSTEDMSKVILSAEDISEVKSSAIQLHQQSSQDAKNELPESQLIIDSLPHEERDFSRGIPKSDRMKIDEFLSQRTGEDPLFSPLQVKIPFNSDESKELHKFGDVGIPLPVFSDDSKLGKALIDSISPNPSEVLSKPENVFLDKGKPIQRQGILRNPKSQRNFETPLPKFDESKERIIIINPEVLRNDEIQIVVDKDHRRENEKNSFTQNDLELFGIIADSHDRFSTKQENKFRKDSSNQNDETKAFDFLENAKTVREENTFPAREQVSFSTPSQFGVPLPSFKPSDQSQFRPGVPIPFLMSDSMDMKMDDTKIQLPPHRFKVEPSDGKQNSDERSPRKFNHEGKDDSIGLMNSMDVSASISEKVHEKAFLPLEPDEENQGFVMDIFPPHSFIFEKAMSSSDGFSNIDQEPPRKQNSQKIDFPIIKDHLNPHPEIIKISSQKDNPILGQRKTPEIGSNPSLSLSDQPRSDGLTQNQFGIPLPMFQNIPPSSADRNPTSDFEVGVPLPSLSDSLLQNFRNLLKVESNLDKQQSEVTSKDSISLPVSRKSSQLLNQHKSSFFPKDIETLQFPEIDMSNQNPFTPEKEFTEEGPFSMPTDFQSNPEIGFNPMFQEPRTEKKGPRVENIIENVGVPFPTSKHTHQSPDVGIPLPTLNQVTFPEPVDVMNAFPEENPLFQEPRTEKKGPRVENIIENVGVPFPTSKHTLQFPDVGIPLPTLNQVTFPEPVDVMNAFPEENPLSSDWQIFDLTPPIINKPLPNIERQKIDPSAPFKESKGKEDHIMSKMLNILPPPLPSPAFKDSFSFHPVGISVSVSGDSAENAKDSSAIVEGEQKYEGENTDDDSDEPPIKMFYPAIEKKPEARYRTTVNFSRIGVNDECKATTQYVTKDVPSYVTTTIFDYHSRTAIEPVTKFSTIYLQETQTNTVVKTLPPETKYSTKTILVNETSEIVRPYTMNVVTTFYPIKEVTNTHFHKLTQIVPKTVTTTRSDIILTSPVSYEALFPTTVYKTEYRTQNVLTMDVVTQNVTVTILQPSPTFETDTLTISHTKYLTVTEIPKQHYSTTTVTVDGPPNIYTVTVDPFPITVTDVVTRVSTVTFTLHSSAGCKAEYSSSKSYKISSNSKIISDNSHLLESTSMENDRNGFDEVFWPKVGGYRDILPQDRPAKETPPLKNTKHKKPIVKIIPLKATRPTSHLGLTDSRGTSLIKYKVHYNKSKNRNFRDFSQLN